MAVHFIQTFSTSRSSWHLETNIQIQLFLILNWRINGASILGDPNFEWVV